MTFALQLFVFLQPTPSVEASPSPHSKHMLLTHVSAGPAQSEAPPHLQRWTPGSFVHEPSAKTPTQRDSTTTMPVPPSFAHALHSNPVNAQLPPPQSGYAEALPMEARAILRSVLSASAIGSPETARRQLDEFIARTKPDELIVTAQVYDHQARLKSYQLLMEAVRQSEPAAAAE